MRKFSTAMYGYDKKEVSNFVDDVIREYENVLNKLKDRDRQIALLNENLKKYENLESTLNKAVILAEESSSQIKNVARNEAKSIVETAKKNASYIVNDALIKAEKIEIDADKLRRSLKIYKARIKQALNDQMTIVDDIDNIEIN